VKRETHLRGGQRLLPLAGPSPPLAAPIYPRHPYLPKGAKGQGPMLNQCVDQPDDPTAQ
jgi:hypothetical protein